MSLLGSERKEQMKKVGQNAAMMKNLARCFWQAFKSLLTDYTWMAASVCDGQELRRLDGITNLDASRLSTSFD